MLINAASGSVRSANFFVGESPETASASLGLPRYLVERLAPEVIWGNYTRASIAKEV